MAAKSLDLSAADVRRLLHKLDTVLAQRGAKVTVYVVGGANIALALDGSRTTTDINAVVKMGADHLCRAAASARLPPALVMYAAWALSSALIPCFSAECRAITRCWSKCRELCVSPRICSNSRALLWRPKPLVPPPLASLAPPGTVMQPALDDLVSAALLRHSPLQPPRIDLLLEYWLTAHSFPTLIVIRKDVGLSSTNDSR